MTAKSLVAAAALLAVIAAFVWASQGYLLVLLLRFSDTWAHLAAIRRTAELGTFPGDLFYLGEPTPPYYSLSHVFFALLARVTGRPAHEVFLAAPPVFAALDIAVVFLWLRALTGDTRVAVGGAGVELLLAMPSPPWTALPYPRNVAIAPFYLAWFAYVRGRPERRWPWLAAAGVGLGLCLSTHLFTGGLCLIGLVLQDLALEPARRRSFSPLLLVAAIGLALASPWIGSFAYAWSHRSAETHQIFRVLWESWVPFPGLPLHLLRPAVLRDLLPLPLWVAVMIGSFAAVRRAWRGGSTPADRYALLAVAVGLSCVFTPLYTLPVMAFGVWAPRLLLIVPFSLLAGQGIAVLAGNLTAARPDLSTRLGLGLVSAGLLAWMIFSPATSVREIATSLPGLNQALRQGGPLGTWGLEGQLARAGLAPLVVLSDPDTSYLLPYLIGSYVVTMPAAHGSPYADHTSREKEVQQFYHAAISTDRLTNRLYDIMEKVGADAVAIAPASTWPSEGVAPMVLQRLRRTPGFEDTGCCEQVVFLRYVGRPMAPKPRHSP